MVFERKFSPIVYFGRTFALLLLLVNSACITTTFLGVIQGPIRFKYFFSIWRRNFRSAFELA